MADSIASLVFWRMSQESEAVAKGDDADNIIAYFLSLKESN